MENYAKSLRNFVIDLYKINAIKFGEYKTKIGLMTPIYCDLRVIVSHPRMLNTLSDLIIEKTKELQLDLICGVPYTALPIATAVSMKTDLPMVMRRKEVKDYGTKRLIEGAFVEGDRCLVIEDVVTSGGSVLETARDLRSSGIRVSEAIVLLNREQGAVDYLKENGISTIALLSLTELAKVLYESDCIDGEVFDKVVKYVKENQVKRCDKQEINRLKISYGKRGEMCKNKVTKELFEIMERKQSNLCIAADITDTKEILNLAETVGPYICLFKLHADTIENFNDNFVTSLQKISNSHDFLLFEDRKFADIGKTVQTQYTRGVHRISEWAHLVTAHSLMGKGTLEAIAKSEKPKNRSVFVLAESSTEGLITPEYVKATIEMGKLKEEVVTGFVCQSAKFLDQPHFIQLTPGVNINATVDDLDQKYNSPEAVVIEKGADIAVVGRGIVKAADIEKTAGRYCKLLWEAYEKRIKKN